MTDLRDPFAGALVAPSVPRESSSDRRILFTTDDERRIQGLALWSKIVGIITLCAAGLSGIFDLLRLVMMPFSFFNLLSAGLSFVFSLLLGLFLLQAARPLHRLAVTDEADKQYLIAGCQGLTKYFNLLGVFMVFAVGLLAVSVAVVLVYLARSSG